MMRQIHLQAICTAPRDVVKWGISDDIGNSTFHVGFPPVTSECATPPDRPSGGDFLDGDMMGEIERFSITEARLKFGELVKLARYTDKVSIITSYNTDMAYIVPESMFVDMLEKIDSKSSTP